MSTKRKKQIEYDKRVFVDRYGHPYHQLAWGVGDDPNQTPHLEIMFSRIEFPTDEGDTHEFMMTMGDHTEVLPRSMLIEMLLHGWNGELVNERLICEDPRHA